VIIGIADQDVEDDAREQFAQRGCGVSERPADVIG